MKQIGVLEVDIKYLYVSFATPVYKLAQEGKIPCQKVGRHWRFRKEALDRWLEEGPNNEKTRTGTHDD